MIAEYLTNRGIPFTEDESGRIHLVYENRELAFCSAEANQDVPPGLIICDMAWAGSLNNIEAPIALAMLNWWNTYPTNPAAFFAERQDGRLHLGIHSSVPLTAHRDQLLDWVKNCIRIADEFAQCCAANFPHAQGAPTN